MSSSTFTIPELPHHRWPRTLVEERLGFLAADFDPQKYWICKDLTFKERSPLGNFFWNVARHFEWLRSHLFGVNLDSSKQTLQEIRTQILQADERQLIPLFNQAVAKLEGILDTSSLKLAQDPLNAQAQAEPVPPPQAPLQVAEETPAAAPLDG